MIPTMSSAWCRRGTACRIHPSRPAMPTTTLIGPMRLTPGPIIPAITIIIRRIRHTRRTECRSGPCHLIIAAEKAQPAAALLRRDCRAWAPAQPAPRGSGGLERVSPNLRLQEVDHDGAWPHIAAPYCGLGGGRIECR